MSAADSEHPAAPVPELKKDKAEKKARKSDKSSKKSEIDDPSKVKKHKHDKKDKEDKKDKKDNKDKKDKKDKSVKDKKGKKEKKLKNSEAPEDSIPSNKAESNAPTASSTPTTAQSSHSSNNTTSDSDTKAFLDQNAVKIETSAPTINPVLRMDQVPVSPELATKLSRFPKPTPIQSATWPYLLKGLDVVGVAETGSGKTLAFGIPACHQLISQRWPGISTLIVSPTRELAMQIYDNLHPMMPTESQAMCVYGGVPKYEQQRQLAQNRPHIVVGTPGRLRDLIADGSLPLQNVRYLVLDEADRMLEKGFEQDMKEIVGQVPTNRQTVMFTATWPPQVRDLASTFMKNGPQDVVKVSIGDADELSANKRITQIVEVVDPRYKEQRFLEVLRSYPQDQKILVFALYKKEAARVESLLRRHGYHVAAIHGDLGQAQRTQALADFKTGRSNLLLATDVAARGLDIPAVKVVINLTFPLTVEDYVHRIGRTARAGETGTAHTLFTDQEKHLAGGLGNVLRAAGQPVPDELLKFGSHTKKKEHSLYGAFFKDVDTTQKAKKIKFD